MNSPEHHPMGNASMARPWLARLVMLLMLAGSVGLVWWRVNHLLLVDQQLEKASSAVAALDIEVQQLEQDWSPIEVAQVEERFNEARESLSGAPEEGAMWSGLLQEEALETSLLATIKLGQSQPHPQANLKLASTPATIELHPLMESAQTNIPYLNLMNFLGVLTKPNWRIDLLDLQVNGNSNSIYQATAVVQFWAPVVKP